MYDPRNEITNSVMQQQPGAMPGQPPPQMSATAGIPGQPAMPQAPLGGMPQAPLGGLGSMTGTGAGVPAMPGGPTQFPNQSMMEGLKAGAAPGAGNVTPLAGAGNFAMPGQQMPQGLGQPQLRPGPY